MPRSFSAGMRWWRCDNVSINVCPFSWPIPGGIVSTGDYSNEMERLIFLSLLVGSFQVRERQEQRQEGFIGVRAVLSHGDLLEAFEFVVATP
jgi:hypothetical protein